MEGDYPMSKLTTTNAGISRRKILIGGDCFAAAASLPSVTMAANGQARKRFFIF